MTSPAATATRVRLTLTTGQLIGGPVSDQRGRRRPLLAAILLMTVGYR